MKNRGIQILVIFVLLVTLLSNLNIKNVSAGCSIIDFSASPGSPQNAGTTINLYAKAQCGANVRAIRFKVDGNIIYELGAPEASATWNTSGVSSGTHSITVEAAEWGDDNWSNPASSTISFQINTTPPPPANPKCQITSFSTSPSSPQTPGTSVSISAGGSCDTGVRAMRVKVDGNIIYELGAPNITATWKSPSSEGSHTIAVEVAGWGDDTWSYAASQSKPFILQNNIPIASVATQTQSPSNTTIDNGQDNLEPFGGLEETDSSRPAWCSIPIIGGLCKEFYLQASDLKCDPQCMRTARNLRPDMDSWAKDSQTPAEVAKAASNEDPFKLSNGWTYTVHVRDETEKDPISAKDLIVWPKDCQKVPYEGGHIGYVESISGDSIRITDSNWGKASPDGVCASRSNVEIKLESCMVFISSPQIINEFDLSLPTADTPSASLRQSVIDWFRNLFGKK